LGLAGCGPQIELPERAIRALPSATELARTRGAYERAADRVDDVARGMSTAEVERAMGGFVGVEKREGPDGEPIERRATIVEGKLCERTASVTKQRWLFGYDEGRVVFVGFAVEFEREDEGENWMVRRVDYLPADDCDGGGPSAAGG
jgi:hypothetical protein